MSPNPAHFCGEAALTPLLQPITTARVSHGLTAIRDLLHALHFEHLRLFGGGFTSLDRRVGGLYRPHAGDRNCVADMSCDLFAVIANEVNLLSTAVGEIVISAFLGKAPLNRGTGCTGGLARVVLREQAGGTQQ